MEGIVFNTQRSSLYDGPGIRTVVFLKGCSLRCRWCHNPEGWLKKPQVMFNAERCIGCGDCAVACKMQLHTLQNGIHLFERNDTCLECESCARACYGKALNVIGKTMSAEEVIEFVKKDLPMYRESGGGITLSGGEPLYQSEFTLEILKLAKENGIHTCVETSGYGGERLLSQIAEYTDLFFFDYKATGDRMHEALCGVPQAPILKNLSLLDKMEKEIVLRCPIVPGLNDLDSHIQGIAEVANRYSHIVEVHLEPYHRMGVTKAGQLGMDSYYYGEVPNPENMEKYRSTIERSSDKKTKIV